MKTKLPIILGIAGLAFATAPAGAQQGSLGPDQVPGATLQLWLDQNVAYAGVFGDCYFMNVAQGAERAVFFSCPGGNMQTLRGKSRVSGNEWCNSFPQPVGEECVTWHALPDGRYTQKRGGVATTLLHVLSVVPMRAAAR